MLFSRFLHNLLALDRYMAGDRISTSFEFSCANARLTTALFAVRRLRNALVEPVGPDCVEVAL
jgi:hypothetical protein